MGEQAFLAGGAVLLVALTLGLVRVGRGDGAGVWALGWVCVYASGLGYVAGAEHPALLAAIPLFGTGFLACLLIGTLLYTGRVTRAPRELIVGAVGLAGLRLLLQYLLGDGASQIVGSLAACVTVGVCSWLLLGPRGPQHSGWDGALGLAFLAIAGVSLFYLWARLVEGEAPAPAPMFAWLLAGGGVGFVQVSAFIARAGEASERERATLATLVDAAPVGLALIGRDGTLGTINRVFAELVGIDDPERVLGRPFHEVVDRLAQTAEPSAAEKLRSIRAGLRLTDPYVEEVELRFRDGRVAIGSMRAVVGSDGQYLGRLWLLREVTEEIQLQEQLMRTRNLETLGGLAGGIAHDFNNKLTAVLGSAEILSESMDVDDPRQRNLLDLENAAEYCATLTRDLLDFARQTPRVVDVIDLAPFLLDLEHQLRPSMGAGVTLEVAVSPDLHIEADPAQLARVVTNLFANANAAVQGTGTIRLEAGVREEDPSRVEISVEDDGVGIDADLRDKIFDPFFSTRDVGDGAGLGLAIVFGIVTSHGGEVAVESRLEGGSRFTTTWPVAPATRKRAESPPAEPLSAGSGQVLLVEDEAPVRRVARAALERIGFEVLEARSGEEAVIMTEGRVDTLKLAVIDMTMPGMSGPETLARLRKEHPGLVAILMSGHLHNDAERHGARRLAKPFRARDLLTAVSEALHAGPR